MYNIIGKKGKPVFFLIYYLGLGERNVERIYLPIVKANAEEGKS